MSAGAIAGPRFGNMHWTMKKTKARAPRMTGAATQDRLRLEGVAAASAFVVFGVGIDSRGIRNESGRKANVGAMLNKGVESFMKGRPAA